jgi:ribose-phosphate pyrophosphokinase
MPIGDKDCLIVDDLCDGGYTFITLADKLRKNGARRVYLYVSHGLFSKGFPPLFAKIDHIYCTNSVKDIDMESTFEYTFDDGGSGVFAVKDYVTQYKII